MTVLHADAGPSPPPAHLILRPLALGAALRDDALLPVGGAFFPKYNIYYYYYYYYMIGVPFLIINHRVRGAWCMMNDD